jgi:hypothetical protein
VVILVGVGVGIDIGVCLGSRGIFVGVNHIVAGWPPHSYTASPGMFQIAGVDIERTVLCPEK